VSDDYYNFNTVREQIILAQKSGLCTFDIHPFDVKKKTGQLTVKPIHAQADGVL